ncbi:MAG: type IV conjugative transfer system coupling protein TraD [Gammaproteobacteria bacterium]|nr:type IV conjugative transfer system coupling protein TraD [Gammaproteobacteria bacterium]
MTNRYQVECLLRPPVEFFSAGLAISIAIMVFGFENWLYMPPSVASVAVIGFTGFGLWRFRQGTRIVSYHKCLRKLPRFTLQRERIPISEHQLYVGKGFRWEARHTQRLRDCLLPHNARYFQSSSATEIGKRLSLSCERIGLPSIASILQIDHWLNPFRPPSGVGGRPEIHGVGLWEGEKPLYSPISERVGHTLVLGTTRVGKTRFAEILINQDIRRGDTTIVIDPKGDAELLKGMVAACQAAGRLDKFLVFHLAYPEHSARYNPIGNYTRITQVATRIANALPAEGNAIAFREFAWRFINIVAQALDSLEQRPTYRLIHSHVSNIDNLLIRYGQLWLQKHGPDDWKDRIEQMQYGLTGSANDRERPKVPSLTNAERSHDIHAVSVARILVQVMQEFGTSDPVADGLLSAFKYERSYFDKITASLGPFLEKLTTGAVAELLSPDYSRPDSRPTLDWMNVIEQHAVVYVGLAALQDAMVSAAVGSAMFSDLTATAGEIYAQSACRNMTYPRKNEISPISLHCDEFNELIGDDFIPMLNKAGGAGFQVTAYTQTWSDVEARIGNRAKAQQIAGNFNTLHMLRVRNKETAELLTDMLPKVQVAQMTTVSVAQHQSDPTSEKHFGSAVQDRVTTSDVPMLEPGDLTRLPKGQSFMLMEGGQLFKLRLPLPQSKDQDLPPNIEALTAHMKNDYHSKLDWARDDWWQNNMPPNQQVGEDFRNLISDASVSRQENSVHQQTDAKHPDETANPFTPKGETA